MVIGFSINGDTKLSFWIRHYVEVGFVTGVIIGKRKYMWGKGKKYKNIFRLN